MAGRGGVRKIGKYWHIYYNVRGKQKKESSRSPKKSDAVLLLNKRLQQSQDGLVQSSVRVSTLLDDLLDEANTRGLRSIKAIEARVRTVRRELGNVRASHVTPSLLRGFRRTLLGRNLTNATVNRHFEVIHRAFVLAFGMGMISNMPAFPERLPESDPRQGFFEPEDFEAIKAELPLWAADVFEFAYFTGWRRNEILGMPWSELDLASAEIHLGRSRSKNKKPRVRPIGPDIAPVIRRRQALRVLGCNYVFHREGKFVPNTTWTQHWRKACIRAGYPDAKLHDARRTAVRNMIRAGVPEGVAMAMSGHKTRIVFERYNIISGDDLREASERLSRHIEGRAEVSKFERR